MNRIIIDGDQARLYGTPKAIPQGQSQFSPVQFSFSEEWANLRKIAQFEQRGNIYNVEVSDDRCFCPSELVKGRVNVRVKGYPEDTTSAVIATANEIILPVSMGFKPGGTPSVPPTPDLYQSLLNKIQTQIGDLRNLTTNDKDSLVAAINEAAASSGAGSSVPKPLTYDYMPEGYPSRTMQITTLMEEQELAFSLNQGAYVSLLAGGFEVAAGQTYTVKWDGTEYECVGAALGKDAYVFGNLSIVSGGADTGEPFIYVYVISENEAFGQFATLDTSASHTISVQRIVETVTPMAEEYLPENIATKSDVESTQKVLDGVFSSVATFTFDKQTSGRDTFVFNAFNYYKISDFNPAPEDVISFKGTSESGYKKSFINAGNNCVEYGSFIIVASAGGCSIPITETVTDSFIAPSAGLYASYDQDNAFMTAGTAEFAIKPSSGNYITGLFLKSCTHGSTKKFEITVDDTGALKVTEVTE